MVEADRSLLERQLNSCQAQIAHLQTRLQAFESGATPPATPAAHREQSSSDEVDALNQRVALLEQALEDQNEQMERKNTVIGRLQQLMQQV